MLHLTKDSLFINCSKTEEVIWVGFEVLTAVSMKMAVFWVVRCVD
jgi:hypothetical protein